MKNENNGMYTDHERYTATLRVRNLFFIVTYLGLLCINQCTTFWQLDNKAYVYRKHARKNCIKYKT